MKEYLVVDGYNVINSWPELNRMKSYNLGLARDKLVEILQNFQGAQAVFIIIVFDAHLSKTKMRAVLTAGNIRVVYTKTGETADTLIEKMIGELPPRSKITVVTNDWDEQRIVLGKGALRMTSGELLERVKASAEQIDAYKNLSSNKLNTFESLLHEKVKKRLEELRRK